MLHENIPKLLTRISTTIPFTPAAISDETAVCDSYHELPN